MCGQDSMYSTTTNPSYIPSNSNQINALSSSLVAGSGFLTDRQVPCNYYNCKQLTLIISKTFTILEKSFSQNFYQKYCF